MLRPVGRPIEPPLHMAEATTVWVLLLTHTSSMPESKHRPPQVRVRVVQRLHLLAYIAANISTYSRSSVPAGLYETDCYQTLL